MPSDALLAAPRINNIAISAVAGTFLGHTFIEKSLTGALVGFFLGGILAEVFFYFKKKKLN